MTRFMKLAGFTLLLCVMVVFITRITRPLELLPQAFAQADLCEQPHLDVSLPLNDLGDHEYIRMDGQPTGFTGGLYPDGANQRPDPHNQAGLAIAAQITPLNVDGIPDLQNGRIVMLSIGMSNTNMEFGAFMELVHQHPDVNPRLALVNGAQANRTAEAWVDPDAPPWLEVDNRLAQQGLTRQQVQVAWVKNVHTRGGDFPEKALTLQDDLEAIARNLYTNYPNIKIAYFSSRTRSYMYERGLSPEPVAFEAGFATKWMVEKQIDGSPELNFDPANGPVNAPYLSWGPYLWIDGQNPRSDGRVWLPEDLTSDCTHPSWSGTHKVAEMLWEFFSTDETATGWFLVAGPDLTPSPTAPPTSVPSPSPTPSDTPLPTPSPTVSATPPPTDLPHQQLLPTIHGETPNLSPPSTVMLTPASQATPAEQPRPSWWRPALVAGAIVSTALAVIWIARRR
jgi:hypothetical protein